MHRRRQEADFLGELAADSLDPAQEFAVLRLIDQRDQAIADFESEHVHVRDIAPRRILRFEDSGFRGRRLRGLFDFGPILAQRESDAAHQRRKQQESKVRHAGNDAKHTDDAGCDRQCFGPAQ